MSKYLSNTLQAVTPYTPGEQPQDQQYIKLNTNESPYRPSPAVVAAVSEAEVEKLRLYSDPACAELLRTAAAHFNLQPDQIMPGNGSDENLFFALRAFCDEAHPLAYADITYGCYGVWCGLMHIPSHIIPLKDDFTLDPADYYGLNETIVLANPNAPTGLALPRSAIEGILKANPDNVVIVDEAYVDFGGESCVPLIDQYENLLVIQTFSKSRQLAGARLGLAMGNAKLIADLNRVKFSLNPYNINRLTLKAGKAALEDEAAAGSAGLHRAGQPGQLPLRLHREKGRRRAVSEAEGKGGAGAPFRRAPHHRLAADHHRHAGGYGSPAAGAG